MKKINISIIVALVICSLVWLTVYHLEAGSSLRVVACDVGQGDAFLITQANNQILIDGGPGSRVLDCLGTHMPFWDRNIELVVLTHPQEDHYGGLIGVFENYSVGAFLTNSLESGASGYQVLKNRVGGSQARVIKAVGGQKLRLSMIYLDILSPGADFLALNEKLVNSSESVLGSTTTDTDPNKFSVVVLATYNQFSALFTGDIGHQESDGVADTLNTIKNAISGSELPSIEYIKVPHHGSKSGITGKLIDVARPVVAVISSGKNNSYGHPHEEVLNLLKENNIKILRTDQAGDVVVETSGTDIRVRP